MNELIIVKQLPIIEENLRALKEEVEGKAERAKNLVCTEDTVKDVKNVRSTLNKEFAELEEQRKAVKAKVLEPYEAFEKVYKECVKDAYTKADDDLKKKISEVEDGLKAEKTERVKAYFSEYLQSKNINFVTYKQTNIKVGLSDSLKSLKDQAKAFIDRIGDDLALINTQDHKEEILVEYQKSLNASQAITMVVNRHKEVEAMQEKVTQAEEIETKKQEKIKEIDKAVGLSTPAVKPVEAPEKRYKAVFEVIGSLDELKAVKAFLESEGIKYDCK